ncbi:MAG: uroporphyrinogen-III methylase and Uroporphyrinogen-III synthase [Eubacterium sp.]|nr:uroporphyrinogen-III methylase and Uroporphyrinogen-III synthase [Eubacterium sp.]
MNGKVYIIGAGPGDYKLLTLKAVEAIKKSDVIVYDRLIDSKVLSFADHNAEFVYVGKQPQRHQVPQKEINKILLKYAGEGKTVARVKGGDPFLFGRGGEECDYLHKNGIEYEVVPGITSAISVPAYAGIPVTHRECASSLHIITGHQSAEKESAENKENMPLCDFETLARQEGTLVFLMGVKNIADISTGLMSSGKSGETPAAVIENGTRPEQRIISGTLTNIVEKCEQYRVKSPAVIVVGEVVNLAEKLAWYQKGLLSGKRIVVTRPAEQSDTLVQGLEEYGAHVTEFPVIRISEVQDFEPLNRALNKLASYSWLVFTSSNGVEILFSKLKEHKTDLRKLHGLKLAAVGPATEEALNARGLYSDYTPDQYTSEQLLNGLLKLVDSKDRILVVNSQLSGPELPQGFKANGINCDEVAVYTTVANALENKIEFLLPELEKAHYITFTSPSAVKAFVSMVGKDTAGKLSAGVICIGPVTENAAWEQGLKVTAVADRHDSIGIMKKIIELVQIS